MLIGGVLLAAGMELRLAPDDYRNGSRALRFMISVIDFRTPPTDWVTLDGYERPSVFSAWRPRRIQVRTSSLKRCLELT